MRSRLSRYFKDNVVAFLALFVALGGTSAYAANTVFSTDIVDGEVKSVDIGNGEVNSADVKDQSLTTFDVSTFLGADVVDNTLTGADVDESTLGQVPSAANSDTLDGINSTDFWRGAGRERRFVHNTNFGSDFQFAVPGGTLRLECDSPGSGNAAIWQFANTSGGTLSAWRLRESTGAMTFDTLAALGGLTPPVASPDNVPERWTLQLSNAGGFNGKIDIWLYSDVATCQFAVHTSQN